MAPPRPVALPSGRAGGLPRPLQRLAEPVRQARLHAGAGLRGPAPLSLLRVRSRVLVELLLRLRLRGRHHGAAARGRGARRPAPERDLPGPQRAAGLRALPLHDPHHRGGDPLEVAAERLLRAGELPPGAVGGRAHAGGVAGTRLHHDRADRHQRLAVLPVRGGDVPGAAPDHRARALRGGHRGRRLRVAPLPARHPAPDRQRAVRDRAAARRSGCSPSSTRCGCWPARAG